MANSDFQFYRNELEDIPDKVDAMTFNKLCGKILGFAKSDF
jgi:hypothetical protein